MSNETIVGGGTISAARSVAALTGNALKVLRVNAGETATEWATAAGGGVLKIKASGATRVAYIVETTDPNASALRIRTTTGTKSIRLKT